MSTDNDRRVSHDDGFTLVEMLVTLAVFGVLIATGIPVVGGAMQRFTLNSSARAVGADIRSTRYAAIAKNRTMAIRFNCPAAGQYRMVEITGNAAIDAAADRCSLATYPYPDTTPGVAPDADGPLLQLPQALLFGIVSDVQFNATGRLPGPTVRIEVTNGTLVRAITVPPNGRVVEQ